MQGSLFGTGPAGPAEETVDSSCSYFYFLWGSHAEYNQKYAEALEAYQKAAICDPKADYIAEKIPVLLIHMGKYEEATEWLTEYIQIRPEKTLQRFMLARLKIQDDKPDEAIALYQEALELEPENNNIRLRLGLLYSKQKDFNTAEQVFKTILEANNESYFATLYLARLYTKTGELDLTEEYYNQALDLNWSKDLSFEVADFYILRKQFPPALALYQGVLEKDPQDERAALGLVQTYLFFEKAEEALDELLRIRGFTGNPDRIDLVRSQILINIGKTEEAKSILLALLEKKTLDQANYLLGAIHYEEKDLDSAIGTLAEIPASSNEFKDSVLLRIKIYEETNRSDDSIELLQEVIATEESRVPLFYSLLASIYQKQDNEEGALQTLAEGAEHFQDDEQILYDYAVMLEKSNEHDKAFSLMEKILTHNPNHPDALNFIGYTLADKNIDLEKAYEYIKKAIQLKPKSGYIQDSLGWVYFRMGQFKRAKMELEKALEMEPDDPFIYDHLGDTYNALSDKDNARFYYEKALEKLTDEDKKNSIKEKINALDTP